MVIISNEGCACGTDCKNMSGVPNLQTMLHVCVSNLGITLLHTW